MQKACSTSCALELAVIEREKKREAEFKERKKALKDNDRLHWMKLAQSEFNKYIRLRDKGLPCISCGQPDNGNHQRHASHYKSVGSNSALRFDEKNVHASCSKCNNWLSGNLVEYRVNLIIKIGEQEVTRLDTSPRSKKWTIDELKEIKSSYLAKNKVLQ